MRCELYVEDKRASEVPQAEGQSSKVAENHVRMSSSKLATTDVGILNTG